METAIIAAMDQKQGIGFNNALPWQLSGDLKHYKTITTAASIAGNQNAVIMGRKTWESLPEKFRPLPSRLNCVITRNPAYDLPESVLKFTDMESAIATLTKEKNHYHLETLFIIGGATLYREALEKNLCQKLYLTQIQAEFKCDAFFPEFSNRFYLTAQSEIYKENNLSYQFCTYELK